MMTVARRTPEPGRAVRRLVLIVAAGSLGAHLQAEL